MLLNLCSASARPVRKKRKMGNFRLERSSAVNFGVSRCCFKEPPTKFALLPFHLAPAPRHRKGRDARIRPRDPRQRALPNAHAHAHARTPREPSFSREKQSRPSLAFFRRTAVALPRLISLRRTHARNARARSRTGDMVNDGKSSSVWSVEEDAELARLQVRPLSKQRFDPHLVFFSVTALAAVVRWVPRAESAARDARVRRHLARR